MDLSDLPKIKKRGAKRRGRGYGSGKGGHTTGRGQSGQKARSKIKPLFEGGQLPLVKRLPRLKGFARFGALPKEEVNLKDIVKIGGIEKVTPQVLLEQGILKEIPRGGVKILGGGEIKKALKFEGFSSSKSARRKIQEAGGSIF